ncbi:hypothetical protein SLNSH_07630 [Alsobacter soli]|uniref:Periplasmic heavy metal sensor n=2 Tax=Alsobacter soli TaxID=2109933 RepID=A0A2T1HUY3_9HYPH|nr:hypothetical protein SLNSH_07630 [Alsobacter soli]
MARETSDMAEPAVDEGRSRERTAGSRRERRWIIVLLVTAIFQAGLLAGGAFVWWRQAHRVGPGVGLARAVMLTADARGREAFRASMAEGRRQSRPQVRDVREARAALGRALVDSNASVATVQEALARLRGAEVALRERLEPELAQALVALGPEGRRELAGALVPANRRAGPPQTKIPGP